MFHILFLCNSSIQQTTQKIEKQTRLNMDSKLHVIPQIHQSRTEVQQRPHKKDNERSLRRSSSGQVMQLLRSLSKEQRRMLLRWTVQEEHGGVRARVQTMQQNVCREDPGLPKYEDQTTHPRRLESY